jgi:glutaminase
VSRKSLVQRSEVDRALKAHNCQAHALHRLTRGDLRLKVYVDRSHDHYCRECALKIVAADIAKLQALAHQLNEP